MDQRAEAFVYQAKCTEDMCKKVFKNIEKAAALTHDAFDAFTYAVKEYMEEKNMEKKCKFEVGDKVINNSSAMYTHTGPGFVGEVVEVMNDGVHIKVKGKSMIAPSTYFDNESWWDESWWVLSSAFDLYNPHEGKILIMVDEKDNNKIIARDLFTNKTAEAKCNPKDEWDFNKGAKLALERLTEPEKPKYWTGKVVCVSNAVRDSAVPGHNDFFDTGKVYDVINGDLYYKPGKQYAGIKKVTDPKDLRKLQVYKCPVYCDFIEFKGEVTAE